MTFTFSEYKNTSKELNKILTNLQNEFNTFKKDSSGLINYTDTKTNKYKTLKSNFDRVFKLLQNLNKKYTKIYKKELRKERIEKRLKIQK